MIDKTIMMFRSLFEVGVGDVTLDIIIYIVLIYLFIAGVDKLFEYIFEPKIGRKRSRLQKTLYKSVRITNALFHISLAFLIVDNVLGLYKFPQSILNIIFFIFVIYVARITINLLLFSTAFYFEKKSGHRNLSEYELIKNLGLLPILYRVVVISCSIVVFLNYIGVEITDLIATLGISSIIIAFALQSVLQDLFASVSVFLDKPFEVGDYIKTETEEGVVTKVGYRSTRVKSKTGELIIIPNKLLSDGKVRNFKQITERKVFNKITIDGNTDTEKLKKCIELIKEKFVDYGDLIFDRISIFDVSNGVIKLEIVFFTKDDDFDKYAKNTTSLNLDMLDILNRNDVKLRSEIQINS